MKRKSDRLFFMELINKLERNFNLLKVMEKIKEPHYYLKQL